MVEHRQNESQVHIKKKRRKKKQNNPKQRRKAQKKSSVYKTLGVSFHSASSPLGHLSASKSIHYASPRKTLF